MNAEIFEFNTAKSLTHRAILRAGGFSSEVSWAVVGELSQRYASGRLFADPDVVAVQQNREIGLIQFFVGATPEDVSRETLLASLLTGGLVSLELRQRGSRARSLRLHWAHSDGGVIQAVGEVEEALRILDEGEAAAQAAGLTEVSVQDAVLLIKGEQRRRVSPSNIVNFRDGKPMFSSPSR
jgi:hypothetical protein